MSIEAWGDSAAKRETREASVNRFLMSLLMQSDGSTTKLIEAIVGAKVRLALRLQRVIPEHAMPREVRALFAGNGPFMQRVTSLAVDDVIVSDNAVFADMSRLTGGLAEKLNKGEIPLGLLIESSETRREISGFGYAPGRDFSRLYAPSPVPADVMPGKQYAILKDGECWFYVCERFREAKLVERFWDRTIAGAVTTSVGV